MCPDHYRYLGQRPRSEHDGTNMSRDIGLVSVAPCHAPQLANVPALSRNIRLASIKDVWRVAIVPVESGKPVLPWPHAVRRDAIQRCRGARLCRWSPLCENGMVRSTLTSPNQALDCGEDITASASRLGCLTHVGLFEGLAPVQLTRWKCSLKKARRLQLGTRVARLLSRPWGLSAVQGTPRATGASGAIGREVCTGGPWPSRLLGRPREQNTSIQLARPKAPTRSA
jgi:hypothetical protein